MISFAVSFPRELAEKLKAELQAELQAKVFPLLRERANAKLDEYIEGPTAKYPQSGYSLQVDGRLYKDRSAINNATSRITITVLQATINLAIRVMQDILSQAALSFASPQAWINRERLGALPEIRMFYGQKDKGIIEVTSAAQVPNFAPGDFLALTPTYGTQIFSNAKKFGAGGYMGKAARKIRARIKASNRDSPIKVTAGRSRAVYERLEPARRRDGSVISKTHPERGAWVIYIRYRQR